MFKNKISVAIGTYKIETFKAIALIFLYYCIYTIHYLRYSLSRIVQVTGHVGSGSDASHSGEEDLGMRS